MTIIKIKYPPVPNVCPDYWQYGYNMCLIPENKRNIGTLILNDSTPGFNSRYNGINFNDSKWSNVSSTAFCAKQKWANMNNILWDGITNVNGDC
jgi:hypothetical protein